MFSDTPIYIVCFANIQTIIFFAFENINAEHVLIPYTSAALRRGQRTLAWWDGSETHTPLAQQNTVNIPPGLPSQIPQEGFHIGERNHIQIHMFGIIYAISIHIPRNRSWWKPRPFSHPNNSKHLDFRHGHGDQKHHGTRNVQTTPRGENLPVGRSVLDGRLLSQYCGTARQSCALGKLCEETGYQKLPTVTPANVTILLILRASDWYPDRLAAG